MKRISKSFTSLYESELKTRYTIFGSVFSLPAESGDLSLPQEQDLLQSHFTIIEEGNGFIDQPRQFTIYLGQVNGQWRLGQIQNQIFKPIKETHLTKFLAEIIPIVYEEAEKHGLPTGDDLPTV